MEQAYCCLCFPIKTGLYIAIFYFAFEEFVAVPEFIEFRFPFWYSLCLGLSLVPGFMSLYFMVRWVQFDGD